MFGEVHRSMCSDVCSSLTGKDGGSRTRSLRHLPPVFASVHYDLHLPLTSKHFDPLNESQRIQLSEMANNNYFEV